MSSIREQIATALITALSAVGGPAGLTVHRERTRPIETDSLPAILVYFADEKPKPFDKQKYRSPLVERTLSVALQCRAQGSQSASPDQALDPVLLWAAQQVFADETLGGLAIGVEEGATLWSSKEADVPVAAATLSVLICYRTSRLDPSKNPTNS